MSFSASLAALSLAFVLAAASCGGADDGMPATLEEAMALEEAREAAAPPASSAGADPELVPADTTTAFDSETTALFERIISRAEAERWADRPYGEIIQLVGEQLQGQPYVAGMLDEPEEETLVVTLRGFDCVLYIENVVALARAIALGTPTYAAYAENVERQRYRDGEMQGYCSRLHYFSDWIRDNQARGWVRNVTAEAGGEPFDKRLTFMSEHRESYPKLDDDATYACIVDMERRLAGLDMVVIPQDAIAESYGALQPGDIIATATSIGGLDVTHTGFVHKTPEQTGFMHASLSSNAVKISPDLQSYVQGIRSQVGVVVARPIDPRQ